MTTTMITRPQYFNTERPPVSGDLFTRVLAAVNSHRTCRQPSRPHRTTQPEAALGAHLLAVVRAQDATIPATRHVPRTVAEMRARLNAAALTEEESDAWGVCEYWRRRCSQARPQTPATAVGLRPVTVLDLTDAEREELSRRVAEENKRSEQRPR